MLRNKGLTKKLMVLGIDGMEPRFTKRLLKEGKLPNVQKLIDAGSCRDDLMLLGANPTITPPLWATLATGCYPMTHGITDYNVSGNPDKEITLEAFASTYLKAEPIFNVTAKAGLKTLVFHWPGGSFPPSLDSDILYTVDGSSPGACCGWASRRDEDTAIIASTLTKEPVYKAMSTPITNLKGDETLKNLWWETRSKFLAKPSDEAMKKVEAYKEKALAAIDVEGYTSPGAATYSVTTQDAGAVQWFVNDWPLNCSMSPISEPEGWAFELPAGSKEFTITWVYGNQIRYGVILQNMEGKYDSVAIYKDKQTAEVIRVLRNDVFEDHVYDVITTPEGKEAKVTRNMRLLEIAEDGTYGACEKKSVNI